MRHFASAKFWSLYTALPAPRKIADKNYGLLRVDPHHPSLHFKRIGTFGRSLSDNTIARLGLTCEGVQWFLIGTHADYDRLIG